MASHLTITSGTTPTRPFASQTGALGAGEASDVLGIFASLLGQNTVSQEALPAAKANADLSGLFPLELSADLDGEGEAADPQIDGLVGVPLATMVEVNPAPVVNLFDALTRVKASLDAGGELDPDLLAAVEKSLGELGKALGLDVETLPVPDDFASLIETGAEDTGLAGALTQLLAPLANSISTAQKASDATGIAAEVKAAGQLKSIGDKLAALLGALEADAVPEEKLAAVGMPAGQPAVAEIEEALSRFAASVLPPDVPVEPELAAPALKLSEPVLAGKSADAPEPAPTPAPPQATEETPVATEGKSDEAGDRGKTTERTETRREPSTVASFVASNADRAPTETQATTSQQAPARIDSNATSRVVVQPGYQTSQQQLNLPQIAFELARQVDGGNSRFQIRLDPPELGRIDVRLEFDNSGTVSARLTVEKSETLDLMQRDQRGLERALQQAGLDSQKTNLEFSLKQNPFAGQHGFDDRQAGQGQGRSTGADSAAAADDTAEPAPTVNLYRGTLQPRGVNIIA